MKESPRRVSFARDVDVFIPGLNEVHRQPFNFVRTWMETQEELDRHQRIFTA